MFLLNFYSRKDPLFKILIVNYRSIINIKLELHHVISSMEPDAIIGSETHLNSSIYDAELFPHKIASDHVYKVFRKDRDLNMFDKKGGGGVIILVKPTYDCKECSDLDTNCELIWLKITTPTKKEILIGAFYREPKSSLDALDQLNNSLCKINNNTKYKNCIIKLGGDFNLGDINWENSAAPAGSRDKAHCDKLCLIARNHLLEQINTMPTREGRTLDLLFTSHPSTVIKHTICPPIGMSDHEMLQVTTSLKSAPRKRERRTVYRYGKADWDSIKLDLCSCRDRALSSEASTSAETLWNDFKSTVSSSM